MTDFGGNFPGEALFQKFQFPRSKKGNFKVQVGTSDTPSHDNEGISKTSQILIYTFGHLYGNFEFFSPPLHISLFFQQKRRNKRKERGVKGNPYRKWRDFGGNMIIFMGISAGFWREFHENQWELEKSLPTNIFLLCVVMLLLLLLLLIIINNTAAAHHFLP